MFLYKGTGVDARNNHEDTDIEARNTVFNEIVYEPLTHFYLKIQTFLNGEK